jgi:hypothetical protein
MDETGDSSRIHGEYLGKGIDATRPQVLLHAQIIPTTQNVETRKVGTGVQDWGQDLPAVKDTLHLSLSKEPAQIDPFPVGFEMQGENPRDEATGKQIHNETVLFDTTKIQSSSIHLVDLLRRAATEKDLSYSPGIKIPAVERDKICKGVVRDRNEGVTHYISSVDLGAKVYKVAKKDEEESPRNIEVDFSQATRMKAQIEHQIYLVVDPSVELKLNDTTINEEQEKMISYTTKPLWSLVDDPAWRQSVKKACEDYVYEWAGFVIKAAGSEYYLKMGDPPGSLIGGTEQKDAAVFSFVFPKSGSTEEPTNEDYGFYLRCRSGSSHENFYLTANPSNGLICPQRAISVKEEQAKFFLVHPGTRQKEKVSSWKQQESLHLVRYHVEKGWLSKTVEKKYMYLDTTSQPLLKEKSKLSSDMYCLFSIELV